VLPSPLKFLAVLSLLVAAAGCATTGANRNPADPLEPVNRATYKFNDTVDKAFFKPIALGYRKITPRFFRTGVTNFFSNIADVSVVANDLFQAKFRQAGEDTGRVILNSTFGLLGLVDFAGTVGLRKHNEDFGQTLGYWGVKSGPYLVLPFLGPSSVRDGAGRLADSPWGWWRYVGDVPARNVAFTLDTVNVRSNLLEAEKVLDEAALDPYSFLRDAYLQRRERLVRDGKAPDKPIDYDLEEEEEDVPAARQPKLDTPTSPPREK
jgi:phospholipid-binding lipoprotein MlaA